MRPALDVADIFCIHRPAWRLAQAGHLSLGQLKVMSAIEACRTAELGGHVERCEDCDHVRIAYLRLDQGPQIHPHHTVDERPPRVAGSSRNDRRHDLGMTWRHRRNPQSIISPKPFLASRADMDSWPIPVAIQCATKGRRALFTKLFRLGPGGDRRADFGRGRDGSATAR